MREITVATVQMFPRLNEVEANLVHMAELIKKICQEQPVDLIVFPELATTGYECGVRFTDLAERIPGHSMNVIAEQAREFNTHVVFGMVAKERVESIIYNTAVLVGPDGEMLGDYRKVHPKGEERLAFRPGYRYSVVETDFGLVGLMLGWDLAFPEVARSLALDGAELIAIGANWEQPNVEEWRIYAQARAYENSVFVAAANRIGAEYTYTFGGHSMVVGPRGTLHASVDEDIEGYCVARIDLDDVRKNREELQQFQCRQPATYRSIVRKY
jgi:predicted amidohydrolase